MLKYIYQMSMEREKTKEDRGMNECGKVVHVVVSDTEKRDGEVCTLTSFVRG